MRGRAGGEPGRSRGWSRDAEALERKASRARGRGAQRRGLVALQKCCPGRLGHSGGPGCICAKPWAGPHAHTNVAGEPRGTGSGRIDAYSKSCCSCLRLQRSPVLAPVAEQGVIAAGGRKLHHLEGLVCRVQVAQNLPACARGGEAGVGGSRVCGCCGSGVGASARRWHTQNGMVRRLHPPELHPRMRSQAGRSTPSPGRPPAATSFAVGEARPKGLCLNS